MSSPEAIPADCLNCGAALHGAYCARCGQKAGPAAPTLHDLVHDLTHEFLHVDGKIFRTLRLLFTRPGLLTAEAFAGRRATYISPIRVYLIFSVAYFAVAAAFTSTLDIRISDAGAERDPAVLLGFGSEGELAAAVTGALNAWVPRAMFVLVPMFAALLKALVRRSGRNYPQHVIFALHVHAAWFLAAAVGTAARFLGNEFWPVGAIQMLAFGYAGLYLVLALRRAYALPALPATARALLLGIAYGVLVLAAVTIIVLPTVLSRR